MGETSGEEEKAQVRTQQNGNVQTTLIYFNFSNWALVFPHRHMIVPGRENLYTTLANNQYIINQQKNRLERLVKELISLRLYNKAAAQAATCSTATTSARWGGNGEEDENVKPFLKWFCGPVLDKQFGQWAWKFEGRAPGIQAGLHSSEGQIQISKYYSLFST